MNLMGPFQLRIYSVGFFSPYLAQFLLRVQHPNLRKDLAALWHTHHAERNLCSIICAVPLPAPPAGSQEIRRLSINWCKKQDPSGLHTLCWCHSASLVVNFISNITNHFFFFSWSSITQGFGRDPKPLHRPSFICDVMELLPFQEATQDRSCFPLISEAKSSCGLISSHLPQCPWIFPRSSGDFPDEDLSRMRWI